MKVSARVHYGLRAMTELARCRNEDRLVSIAEIARAESLPVAYLEQLVGELRRAGLVEGMRGMRGGYRLARSPAEITVGDVYRVLEGEVAPVECTAEDYLPGSCSRDNGCLSRSIWERVQQSILSVLDSTTLNDLVATEGHSAGMSFVPLASLTPTPATSTDQAKRDYVHA